MPTLTALELKRNSCRQSLRATHLLPLTWKKQPGPGASPHPSRDRPKGRPKVSAVKTTQSVGRARWGFSHEISFQISSSGPGRSCPLDPQKLCSRAHTGVQGQCPNPHVQVARCCVCVGGRGSCGPEKGQQQVQAGEGRHCPPPPLQVSPAEAEAGWLALPPSEGSWMARREKPGRAVLSAPARWVTPQRCRWSLRGWGRGHRWQGSRAPPT